MAKINILDDGGYCSVEIEDKKPKLDLRTQVLIDDVWKGFRIIMDGCSGTVCDCTAAMPIYIEADEEPDEKSIFDKIAENFIRKIERETDGAIGVVGDIINKKDSKTLEDWEILWKKSRELQNLTKSNHLYFGTFLEIYKEKFSRERVEKLDKMMIARCEKARISYDDNMRGSEHGYKVKTAESTNKRISIAERSLNVAHWSRILAVGSLIVSGLALLVTLFFAV